MMVRAETIRPAVAADFEQIDAFDPFGGDRAEEIAGNHMIVAEIDGTIAGYISAKPEGFIGRDFISFLCVNPAFRRRGIASRLLRATEARLSGRVFISTDFDNLAMLALLPREGWTCAGTVEGVNDGDRGETFFYKGNLG
jgi:ribosomal protein S18 acetylase RimI-like enzyme